MLSVGDKVGTGRLVALLFWALIGALSCGESGEPNAAALWSPDADAQGHTAPTEVTLEANAELRDRLPFDDVQDFEDAKRGLVAGDGRVLIKDAAGRTVWDTDSYGFVAGEAPGSVNPSLWRQARLNSIHGLFQVAPGLHQIRGYDLSNMSLIDGDKGWILVDPLTAAETARAALDLARRHLGDRPISAVIFTHSHIDHFGGIDGVLPADESERKGVRIIAPAAFMHEATSENVIAGPTMLRRAALMYGMPLERGVRGHVGTGLGKEPALGSAGIAVPTDIVDHTGQEMTIDGVRFVFQYVPDSEAPAELNFYLPHIKALGIGEIVSHTMHNLYTLRGAKVRDALLWSGYIDEAKDRFSEAEVLFTSHSWPTWGPDRIRRQLEVHADTYRYIHDQTLRLASAGHTPAEIAEELELPSTLRSGFSNRGYYGTLRHNAKAVYQRYFGWYDANPANLDPLPAAEAGAKVVALMGGAGEVRRKASEAFDRGEYRWVATLLNHLVFADPEDSEARELLARAYDQLAYVAESGPWRDVYLTGARELRHGVVPGAGRIAAQLGLLRQVPMARFFESMATHLNGPEADGIELSLEFVFTDLGESYRLRIENSVLHHASSDSRPDEHPDATIRLTHEFFLRLVIGDLGLRDMLFSDDLEVEGSKRAVLSFFSLLDAPDQTFAIVTP